MATVENLTMKKMSNGPILNYDGYDSCDFPKNFHSMEILKVVKKINKKIASLGNSLTKKISTGPNRYYNGYGSYGLKKNPFNETP